MHCVIIREGHPPVFSGQHPPSDIERMLYYSQLSAALMKRLSACVEQLKPEEGIQWNERSGQHRQTFEFGISFKKMESGEGIIRIEMPEILIEVREELVKLFEAQLSEKDPQKYENCILTIYLEGDAISAHTDRGYFGPDVIGLVVLPDSSSDSLKPASALQFFHPISQERVSLVEQEGTAFLFQGALRKEWKHELLPVITKRVALQFRTVNEAQIPRK